MSWRTAMSCTSSSMSESGRRAAVVDIGSNAVRLQVGKNVDGKVITEVFTRVPLALGGGAFRAGAGAGAARNISAPLRRRLVHILAGMARLTAAMHPCTLRAVATAALRSAPNRAAVLEEIKRECGIRVRVLSGAEEAAILGRYAASHFPSARVVLNADIGGGSTDCALIKDGKLTAAETFHLGTSRADGGAQEEKARCAEWLQQNVPKGAVVSCSGGSARVLYECCGALSIRQLTKWQRAVQKLTAAEIAARHPITPDRAAQVNEAVALYCLLLRGAAVDSIHPVHGGLAEALIAAQAN